MHALHWRPLAVVLAICTTFVVAFVGMVPTGPSAAQAQQAKTAEREARERRIVRAYRREISEFQDKGLIYKSPYFWQYFSSPDRMEALFYGRFEMRGLLDQPFLAAMIKSYVISKWEACRASMTSDLAYYEITKTTVTRRRGTTTSEVTGQFVVGVSSRFVPHFERHFQDRFTLEDLVSSVRQLGAQWDLTKIPGEFFKGTLSKYFNPAFDAPKFIRLVGCGTPTMVQFEENLLRALDGQPPARNIAGAADASDVGFLEGRYASLGEACFMSSMFRSEQAEPRRLMPYCVCVERALTAALQPNDILVYVGDYDLLDLNPEHQRLTVPCRR